MMSVSKGIFIGVVLILLLSVAFQAGYAIAGRVGAVTMLSSYALVVSYVESGEHELAISFANDRASDAVKVLEGASWYWKLGDLEKTWIDLVKRNSRVQEPAINRQ